MTSPSKSTSDEGFRVDTLRRKAVDCLETFPKKIDELRKLVKDHAPKAAKVFKGRRRRRSKGASTRITTIKAPSITPQFAAKANCSLAICDRDRGVRKRRYCRLYGVRLCDRRRRPGPLGHLLGFILRQLVFCARKILLEPSRYLTASAASAATERTNPTNLESSSNTEDPTSPQVLNTTSHDRYASEINDAEVIRPIAIQLITDTTTLKQWLQALLIGSRESPPHELANASRVIETIDYWAYNFFFQHKYLGRNGAPRLNEKFSGERLGSKRLQSDSLLCHRLMELCEKYNTLYESLRKLDEIRTPKGEARDAEPVEVEDRQMAGL